MANYTVLKELGLSQLETACYKSLVTQGGSSVAMLAKRLKKQPTGLYRQLHRLETMGFIDAVQTTAQPTYFYANPLETALSRLAKYHRQKVLKLIETQAAKQLRH